MESYPNGQGHGIAGRYAGLTDEFSHARRSQIVVIPVPFDLTTTYQQGAQYGPEALIEASRHLELYDIETNSEVYRLGIHTAPPVLADSCDDLRDELYQQVSYYLNKGQFVVTLGGEHSISFAPIRAYANLYPNLSILQIDAHADLQDTYEGNPWSHACVMARVREIPRLSSLVAVGVRSMSAEEVPFVDKSKTFFAHDLHPADETWMDQVVDQLSDHVYITFDLDAFDSSLMPSTGTPEPGGLWWNQTMNLLKRVAKKKQIVGFDVVELCPNPSLTAPDYLAAKLVYKILSYQFQDQAKNR